MKQTIYRLRRTSHGFTVEGLAGALYRPARRGKAAHYADSFSRALWLAKKLRPFGERLAWESAETLLKPLVPDGFTCVACPPPTKNRRTGWYLARELAAALASVCGLRLLRPLLWARPGEASKELVTHKGKGRALRRRVICEERLDGERVILCDDLWTTGMTAQRCVEALLAAGAEEVFVITLGVTEGSKARLIEDL